ncbi:hypothetical protein ACQR0V_12135 [Bradyrhizobium sp. HKCCYLS2058]|uniref:hypothetical protein n=1 Tax=unclassified Bradyrhizobium TaxID=2631580 RepID=UPI003EBCA5CE
MTSTSDHQKAFDFMFVIRHFFSLVFVAAVGLAIHLTWFANTHHGTDKRVEYWPGYCVLAPITTDACATTLALAHYVGAYDFDFGHYENGSGRRLVRIDETGSGQIVLPLPVVPGTPEDPDSEAAKQEQFRLQQEREAAEARHRDEIQQANAKYAARQQCLARAQAASARHLQECQRIVAATPHTIGTGLSICPPAPPEALASNCP